MYNLNKIDISEELNSVIQGLLLSDGSMRRTKYGANFILHITNLDIIKFLSNIFNKNKIKYNTHEIKAYTSIDKKNNNIVNHKNSYWIQTRNHEDFLKIFNKWYPYNAKKANKNNKIYYVNNKKIVPKDLDINPIVLYLWYVGDGNNRFNIKGKGKSRSITIYTDGFNKQCIEYLIKKLEEYFSNNNISIHKARTKNTIYIKKRLFNKFLSECIKSNICLPSFNYKFNGHRVEPGDSQK